MAHGSPNGVQEFEAQRAVALAEAVAAEAEALAAEAALATALAEVEAPPAALGGFQQLSM
jgi:hypothetical protein